MKLNGKPKARDFEAAADAIVKNIETMVYHLTENNYSQAPPGCLANRVADLDALRRLAMTADQAERLETK